MHEPDAAAGRGADLEPYTGPYQHFCILNDNVFEHILSFLSNQALTKLQAATGDRYPTCEPVLAQYCCRCGNDNPKLGELWCRECRKANWLKYYRPLADRATAISVYGLKIRDLMNIPQQHPLNGQEHTALYSRVGLENYLINKYGSKIGWLREIARRDMVDKKIELMEQQEREDRQVFMESMAPGFATYAMVIGLDETNRGVLWQCGQRFAALAKALKASGLELETDSKVCQQFVALGYGDIAYVVDTVEEEEFLARCTDYRRRCQRKIENVRRDSPYEDNSRWNSADDEVEQECRDAAKMELCVIYLEDNRGLELPRKWENNRSRLEEVRCTGGIPVYKSRFIYNE